MPSNRSSLSLLLLAAALLVCALWRVEIALTILFKPTLENNLGALVDWRLLDSLAGPLCVLLLAGLVRRWAAPAAALLGAGTFLYLLGILLIQVAAAQSLATGITRAGAIVAVAGALLVVFRELKEVSDHLHAGPAPGAAPRPSAGFDLLDLWRLVTVQWVLVWCAAEIVLRLRMSAVDLAASPHARTLLFALPTLGILPNALLIATLRWWPQTGPPSTRGRPRAWLLAMLLVNLGAIVMIVFPRATAAGAALTAAGIGLFLMGLPALRPGLLAALAWLAIAIMAWAALSLYSLLTGNAVHLAIEAGVRYLLYPGGLELWLLATGLGALKTSVPQRYRALNAARAAAVLLPLGVAGTALVLLLQSLGIIQLLSATTLAELFALAITTPLAARALRLVK